MGDFGASSAQGSTEQGQNSKIDLFESAAHGILISCRCGKPKGYALAHRRRN